MRKLTSFLIVLLTLVGCATKGSKSFSDLGEPDVFCSVIQKPAPLLIGTWEAPFTRVKDIVNMDKNYVKYRLMEHDGKYALYFYRTWRGGKKRLKEWKNWSINGKEILGEPRKFGVKIFVQGNDVYFTIRCLKESAKMSRLEN